MNSEKISRWWKKFSTFFSLFSSRELKNLLRFLSFFSLVTSNVNKILFPLPFFMFFHRHLLLHKEQKSTRGNLFVQSATRS